MCHTSARVSSFERLAHSGAVHLGVLRRLGRGLRRHLRHLRYLGHLRNGRLGGLEGWVALLAGGG